MLFPDLFIQLLGDDRINGIKPWRLAIFLISALLKSSNGVYPDENPPKAMLPAVSYSG
jgi:hypothetical protein